MSLISAYDGNVAFYRDGALVIKNANTGTVQKIDRGPVLFMSNRYLVDAEKNLHVLDGFTPRSILKLRRGIFCLLEHNGAVYVADRFGDVHRIEDGRCEYVLGTLSYLTGMAIHNGNILLGDRYGRIRISGMDGRIAGYVFCGDPIKSLELVNGSLVSVSNRHITQYNAGYSVSSTFELPEGTEVTKTMCKGKDELIVLCLDSHFLFRVEGSIGLVAHSKEVVVDGVCSGSVFYKVMPSLAITDDTGKVFYE